MAMTRDQLRAARILLHLRQPELAKVAKMGVATLRRYEGGQDVGEIYVEALRRVIEEMGIVLLDEARPEPGGATTAAERILPRVGLGVALRPYDELPPATIARLSPSPAVAGNQEVTTTAKPRGRPKKGGPADTGTTDAVEGRPASASRQRNGVDPPKGRKRAAISAQPDAD